MHEPCLGWSPRVAGAANSLGTMTKHARIPLKPFVTDTIWRTRCTIPSEEYLVFRPPTCFFSGHIRLVFSVGDISLFRIVYYGVEVHVAWVVVQKRNIPVHFRSWLTRIVW